MARTPDTPPAAQPPKWLMGAVVLALAASLLAAGTVVWLALSTEIPEDEPAAAESPQAEVIRLSAEQGLVSATAVRAQLLSVALERARRQGGEPAFEVDAMGLAALDAMLDEQTAPLALDGWGRTMRFNPAARAVVSAGQDGQFGTQDDISAAPAAKQQGVTP